MDILRHNLTQFADVAHLRDGHIGGHGHHRVEVPPAGTLVGLVKRAQSEIQTFALKGPEDLAAAQAFIAEHGGN